MQNAKAEKILTPFLWRWRTRPDDNHNDSEVARMP